MRNSKIKAIDLFSGCGGVSCGLVHAGFKVTAAVEIEKKAVKTYKAYPPLSNVNVLKEDICELNGNQILEAAGIKSEELYLLAGCPPCQNFSSQNPESKKKSAEERKKLLFRFLKIIQDIYPPFILMENVPGIKSNSKIKYESGELSVSNLEILNEFISELQNEKNADNKRYIVIENILNAANYGVPQIRKRFVLHAVRYDIFLELQKLGIQFVLPKPTHGKKATEVLKPWQTVNETIGDLPEITAGKEYVDTTGTIHNHKCAGLSDVNVKRMEKIRANGGSRTGLPEDMILECHKKKDSKGKVFAGHKDVYGIMDGNKPSPTMTGGCLCYSKGRYGHPSQNRAISIREAARIQTFPDDFIFSNSLTEAGLQIGNAVPIKLVEASATVIKKAIEALLKSKKDSDYG